MVSVWCYAPNLVGYVRIILLLVFIALYDKEPLISVVCYTVSMAFDALDGFLARLLNQSTRFGAMLDMVTDRLSTICMLMVNSLQHTEMTKLFLFLLLLDIGSHWFLVCSNYVSGGDNHKDSPSMPGFVRAYYSKPVLFCTCALSEVWYVIYYVKGNFIMGPALTQAWTYLFYISTPVVTYK